MPTPLVSKIAYEKFEAGFKSAPNNLTQILRSHHAIEAQIHGALSHYLVLSPRLDLRRIPFLTKVDLLISLGSMNQLFYPFFAEANRLRNRFAHDPDAQLLEDDRAKIQNLYASCRANLAPKGWELSTPGRAMGALFQTVFLAARSIYEQGVNSRIQSRALDQYIADEHPSLKNPTRSHFQSEIDTKIAEIAKGLLRIEHPDVDYFDLYTFEDEKTSNAASPKEGE